MKPILLFLALICGTSLQAGAIHGRVLGLDSTGDFLGIVPHAKIELKDEAGGTVATTTSDDTGFYSISGLKALPYRYIVQAAGFKSDDEDRGFSLPEGEIDYVHDFLLTKEPGASAPPAPAPAAVAQSAVHGRVYGLTAEGEMLGPLPGARIELLTGAQVVATATADSPGGYYEIKNLAPKDYQYRVAAEGYQTEDSQRGFSPPKDSLEYVHDFLLTPPPVKTGRCDLPLLVVKKFPATKGSFVNLPVSGAQILLHPVAATSPAPSAPYSSNAKGDALIPDVPQGDYTLVIDAPECEPYTGSIKVVCDMEQVIIELTPCDQLVHSYVRAMLHDGWGSTTQCQTAADRACRNALRADSTNPAIPFSMSLCELSSGDHEGAQQWLVKAIAQKQNSAAWDHACGMRIWLHLLHHQTQTVMKELRALVLNHYKDRPATPAARETAAICGTALGMLKGPWKDEVTPTLVALLESEILKALPTDLRDACQQEQQEVATQFATLRSACDAAKDALVEAATNKRNDDNEKALARQKVIQTEVAILDPDLTRLTNTLNEFDRNFRTQAAGFIGVQQQAAAQVPALNARLQQIQACMIQDQFNMQDPNMANASMMEIRQHQLEIQQITAQLNALRLQEQQAGAQIANLQAQMGRSAAIARAEFDQKSLQRNTLAAEFDRLDAARTAPFDPHQLSTPEIDDMLHRQTAVKTYRDMPLETRREEMLHDMDCGAAKDPKRTRATAKPIEIVAPVPIRTRPAATAGRISSAPPKALPVTPNAPAPANMGDDAELVLNNSLPQEIRVFTLPLGVENEQLARQLKPGAEALVPAKIGQTFIVRDLRGGELQRHRVTKKIDRLRLESR